MEVPNVGARSAQMCPGEPAPTLVPPSWVRTLRGYILTLEMFKFGLEDPGQDWEFYKVNSEEIPQKLGFLVFTMVPV